MRIRRGEYSQNFTQQLPSFPDSHVNLIIQISFRAFPCLRDVQATIGNLQLITCFAKVFLPNSSKRVERAQEV